MSNHAIIIHAIAKSPIEADKMLATVYNELASVESKPSPVRNNSI
jgi:hypothetical protein